MPRTAPATAVSAAHADLDRQLAQLVAAGVPGLTGIGPTALLRRVAPLYELLAEECSQTFLLVLPGLAPLDRLVSLTSFNGRPGFTTMEPDDLARFGPTGDVEVPDRAYLLLDPDTGPDSLDVPPEKALPGLLAAGRTPLTLDEVLALLLVRGGELLRRETCFSMLASRCGDRRVPALWVSKGAPRLGWCWDGAPHTWLGSASAAARLG